MWNDLYSAPSKIAAPFFLQDGPVYFSGSNIRIFCQAFINKTFIMPKIQVSFRTVVRHKHFTVLYRIHGSRIHIDVWVKLLHGNGISARFQKPPQRRCCNPFSKSRHNASSHKNIFYCHKTLLIILIQLLYSYFICLPD